MIEILNTIDYVDPKTGQVFLRTSAIERKHMVLQLGTPTGELALKAALKV